MVAFPRLERSVYHLINQPKIYRAGELMISQVTTIPGPAPHTKGALPLSPLIKKAEFFSLSCKKGFGIVKHVYLVVEALNFMSRGFANVGVTLRVGVAGCRSPQKTQS